MKKEFLFLVLFFSALLVKAQKDSSQHAFFRIYEDNDALNITSKATDWGYTNGLRLDFFYTRRKTHQNFFTGFNRLAGKNSITTAGWGVMQVMMVPKRTSLVIPAKNDYSYAGALFCVHTIHSANKTKKLNVQSEWVAGLLGPPSFAKQSQVFFHHLIKDPPPRGWDYQLPADLLLNYNLKVEKKLAASKWLELTGGGELFAGSMLDQLSVYLLLKIGGRMDHFSGLQKQYFATNRNKPGVLVTLRPTADLAVYNALLEGGLFNRRSPFNDKNAVSATYLKRQIVGGSLELFILGSFRNISVSFSQKMVSTEFKHYGSHSTGNISIYKAL